MKMKRILALVAASALVFSLAACGGGNTNAPAASNGGNTSTPVNKPAEGMQETPDLILRLSEDQSPDYPTTMGCQRFADLVYERTNGRIRIDVYDSGTLGDTTKVTEQLQYGAIDMVRGGASPLSQFSPQLMPLTLPFLYTSTENYYKCMDSDLAMEILKMEDSQGLIGLAYYTGGSRSFYSSQNITCLADLKDLVIRVQESAVMMGMIDALGANPTTTAYSEVYSALQTGNIAAAENSIASYVSTAHYEVAPYLLLSNHVYAPDMLIMSRQVWDQLSAEDQQIFMDAAYESVVYERGIYDDYEAEALQKAIDGGVTVNELTPEQQQEFIDATASMAEELCGDYLDVVQALRDMQK